VDSPDSRTIGGVRRHRAAILALLLAGSNVACRLLQVGAAPAGCGFPPDTAIVWFDDVTPQQAGLADAHPVGGAGSTYVTRDPVLINDSLSRDPAEDRMTDGPAYCFIADTGDTLVIGDVPNDWSPPPGS
jgi:hypothetical protein